MREGVAWALHLLAGVILFFLLLFHVTQMHLALFPGWGESALEWVNVVARAGAQGWKILYLVFLAAALYHGFFGLRNVLIEISFLRKQVYGVTIVLSALGVILFAYGFYTTLATPSPMPGLP